MSFLGNVLFLPASHTQCYAPEAFIKHTERTEKEFNFSS